MTREDDLLSMGNARDSKLYALFLKNLPSHQSEHFPNVLNCNKLGNDLGISDKAIYRWFDNEYVPGRRVRALINLEGSTLTAEKLLPFLSH